MLAHEPDDIVKIPRAEYVKWCRERLDQCHYSSNHCSTMPPSSSTMAAMPCYMDSNSNNDRATPSGSRFGFALPHEILLEVFSHFKESQWTLYAVSLVCRQWMLCVTPLLYRHVRILDTYRWATFILTLTRDKRTFCYGHYISTLSLTPDNAGGLYGLANHHNGSNHTVHLDTSDDTSTTTIATISTLSERLERVGSRDDQQQPRNSTASASAAAASTTTTSSSNAAGSREHQVFVTTSSLMQIADTCRSLTRLDLSMTSIMYDSLIVETGEYLSTLQNYAVQPGLTQVLIPMERVIETFGEACPKLREVVMQRCEWGTAQVIWMWASHCQSLERLDARGCNKCTVKELVIRPLEVVGYDDSDDDDGPHHHEQQQQQNDSEHRDLPDHQQPSGWAGLSQVPRRTEGVPATLAQMVHDILHEAKDLGANDLGWFSV